MKSVLCPHRVPIDAFCSKCAAEVPAKAGNGLVGVSEAKRLIATAIAEGDSGSLRELRTRASAAELYQARSGARETANEAGEIKVRAERGLALLDVAAAPRGRRKSSAPPEVSPLADLHKETRAAIRKLAPFSVEEFEGRLDIARADENAGISTSRVLKAANDDFTGTAMSSKTAEWATPQDLFDELDREFQFTVDVCASEQNAKCDRYFTAADDGLGRDWTGTCWMNPPYGDVIAKWVAKAWAAAGTGCTVVCLVPARVDTAWWWDFCRHGEVRFPVVRSTGYAPAFDLKVLDGDKAESAFARLLCATGDTLEVKSDVKSRETHNIAVEFSQKGRPSGIAVTKAAWYVIETYDRTFICLPTEVLKEAARLALRLYGSKRMGDNGNVGVLVPVSWLVPAGGGLSMADALLIDRIGDEEIGRKR